MKYLLCLFSLLAPLLALAEPVQKGQPFPGYTLPDAHGTNHTLRADTRFVIVASEMPVSKAMTAWLSARETGYLEAHRAEYISDISPMPAVISFMFAKPKMRKYPFRMLLAEDPAFAKTYPRQEGRLAVFILDDRRLVQDIRFLASPGELEPLLTDPPAR